MTLHNESAALTQGNAKQGKAVIAAADDACGIDTLLK